MSEQIKDLIEKIQQEGVVAAENKAKAIETEAKTRAEKIIQNSEMEAKRLIEDARSKAVKMEENTKSLLAQAGRDLLLNLKKEINAMLQGIIVKDARGVLTPEELAKIINMLIRDYSQKQTGEVIVSLSKEDFEKLESNFLNKLKENLKNGIILKPSDDINAGFTISYDQGGSFFDFSDKALAEYISLYLKPKLAVILKDI